MKMALTLAVCAAAGFAQGTPYSIHPDENGKLELHVVKTGLYRGKVHVFLFPDYQGMLIYDAAHPEASQINLAIRAASIKLTDTWLNAGDFKSVQEYALKDMLDVAKYPEMTFVSSAVQARDATHFEVRGTLTIRGVAKPVVVNVAKTGEIQFAGDAKVRLTDFGLKPPKAALGLIGTENEMQFSFVLHAEPER
jgi:polyisoprenoid-binding protein YceI